MIQKVVKAEQVVVQEEGVLAWEGLVSESKDQTGDEPAAAKMHMCHQDGNLLDTVLMMAFLLLNHQNHLYHPLKIPPLLFPSQGFLT